MIPVVQQDMTGCGNASVAALAGVTYTQARKAASGLGIHVTDLPTLIRHRMCSNTFEALWHCRRGSGATLSLMEVSASISPSGH